MKRSLVVLAFVSLALVGVACAYSGTADAWGSGEAASGAHWGAGWLAVTPSRLVAVDAISL